MLLSRVGAIRPGPRASRARRKDGRSTWTISGVIFLSELVGTAMLLLLGCGVVANVALAKTKGNGGGFLLVNFGWGLAVFAGVIVSRTSRARTSTRRSPSASSRTAWARAATDFVAVPVDPARSPPTSARSCSARSSAPSSCGSPTSSTSTTSPSPRPSSAVFSTGPAIRSYAWNLITEIIGTFVLVFVVIGFGVWGDPDSRTRRARPLGARRAPRGRHRRLPRWPDGVRDQPRP